MTDYERAVEFFRLLGVEPNFEHNNNRVQITLDSTNFGGYNGFVAVFDFDPKTGAYLPNKDNNNENSSTGVWE